MSENYKKGLLEAPKMDFMRLRNESTLMMIWVEISTEIIYRSKWIFVGVERRSVRVLSAYVGMQSSTAVLR
jgi:hypothetical protein